AGALGPAPRPTSHRPGSRSRVRRSRRGSARASAAPASRAGWRPPARRSPSAARVAADPGVEPALAPRPLEPPFENLPLLRAPWVADAEAQQEAVELGLRQRIGALVLDRVLRREDEERRRERVRHAFDRHLPLLHPLEHAGLR